jgi:alcohol dehydrogenase (quinone), cytochrome c subunit
MWAGLLGTAALLAHGVSLSAVVGGAATELAATAEQGRYLATAGNCASCHTRPGGAPFAGGLPFETPLGTIYSTNITPDVSTGIGSWTVADLRQAMQHGVARNGDHLFPAFPYVSFTKVSDADIAAIYAYLRTVTPVRYRPPDNGMMFAMRWPMLLWNSLYFRPDRFAISLAKSAEWNRGAYLVEGLGHCGACHTPRNLLLAELPAEAYQGGTLQAPVARQKIRRWSAVDLTNSPRGLGSWSITDLTQYFQTGVSARAGTFGPMNEVIVNSLRQLAPEDLHAMATYLKSLPPRRYADEPVSSQMVSEGAPLYKARCEKCHGRSGRGGLFSGPPLAGSAVVQTQDPASLINIILYGPDAPRAVSYGDWETMAAYGNVLSDEQIASICNFVRGSWGNRAGAVNAKSVRDQR